MFDDLTLYPLSTHVQVIFRSVLSEGKKQTNHLFRCSRVSLEERQSFREVELFRYRFSTEASVDNLSEGDRFKIGKPVVNPALVRVLLICLLFRVNRWVHSLSILFWRGHGGGGDELT